MSQHKLLPNNSGFTLVELMVALLIAMVGMFGVLETINVSLQQTSKNELRNEGVKLGEKYMAEFRGTPFDSIVGPYAFVNVTTSVRGAKKTFVVERSAATMAESTPGTASSKQLTVVVKWAYRNMTSQNRVVSVVARP
ncbi:type IV pilus minor pilin PilV [Citrifermentans bemidjiense Bem]|uniref:Type IV pilus minor pilin PilV n=1 Tax=Citrifermentans bemidjiense (strain ATCC BAA-1014 / DSM 16622 / JCM 12645 / Bem) TaxID=404380 RepID=B5E8H1_CITBB|nr:prepilin-type N-terminal cleavage/methylation domain-containing protein [Citrifermentans bemidjiense]ACH38556.1 type IV pilus minor pilin PilV [Citrifermentans bemidjiense Bem]